MGLAKRIIPCLDIAAGRVVKGVNFVNLRDAGDPVEVARRYDFEGADELAFLDIRASIETRGLLYDMIEAVADSCSFRSRSAEACNSIDDIRALLNAGADKVSINTAGVANPALFDAAAAHYGAQCIVAAIDAKAVARAGVMARLHPRRPHADWASMPWHGRAKSRRRGAGEILLTSMDRDGARSGFDLALTRAVVDAVDVPVIASGGVGSLSDLVDGIVQGGADAVLAASIFHYGEFTIGEAKAALAAAGIEVRERCERQCDRSCESAPGTPADAHEPRLATLTATDPRHGLDRTVKWADDGLVAAIAQDAASGRVLTLAWMNREALTRTAATGEAHYWSRSRRQLWRKGETSGHVQKVQEIRLDCDSDAILLLVEQVGGIACHTGRERCFFQRLEDDRWVEVEPVVKDPREIYGHD